ncbi:metabotropic glutamate receptor 7-like isoform X1 [Styela clava]
MSIMSVLSRTLFCFVFVASQSAEHLIGSQHMKQSRSGAPMQFRDGDIILGAAMQVTNENANGDCVEELTGMYLVETMNMIIDEINANDEILTGIKLGTVMIDTCSSDVHALKRVIMDILPLALDKRICGQNCSDEDSKKHILAGLIGASFSSVSMQLATILQVFHISQVSYWSTSSELSDKTRFEYFFRSVAPDIHQVDAMISFIKEMEWNYISFIYDDDAYGVDGYTEFTRKAEKNNICIAFTKALPMIGEDINMTLVIEELLTRKNARVVVVFSNTGNAEKVFVAARSIPEAVENLIWIGSDGWISYIPQDHTDDSYLDVIDGAIGFLPKINLKENLKDYMTNLTLSQNYGENSTRNPWFAEYFSRKNNCSLPSENGSNSSKRICGEDEKINATTFRIHNTPISDAVYAMVYALDDYHKNICGGKAGLCDEIKQKAGTHQVASELYYHLKNVSFTTSGGSQFKFDKNQDGPPIYDVFVFKKQHVANTSTNLLDGWSKIGTYQDSAIKWDTRLPDKIYLTPSTCSQKCKHGEAQIRGTQKCCWYCQKCTAQEFVYNETACQKCDFGDKPNKHVNGCEPLPIRQMEYNSGHSLFALSFGVFGLLSTIYITFIFIKYRETAIVRASGKELCFFVLFGIFITLLNCFSVTSAPSNLSCTTSRVILSIGPTCMYVGLLMKTIRVVFIFQSSGILTTRTKQYLQPVQFTLITVAVSSVQILILIIWSRLKQPTIDLIVFDDFAFLTCKVLVDIEILVGLIYPFIIIIVCTVLATINRNVPTGFKETLYVGFTMYTTCIIWLALLPIFLTNSTDVPKKLTTVSASLTLSAITVLFCLFAPRCYAILFHPEWNTSESVMSRSRSYNSTKRQRNSTSVVHPDTTVSPSVKRSDSSAEDKINALPDN